MKNVSPALGFIIGGIILLFSGLIGEPKYLWFGISPTYYAAVIFFIIAIFIYILLRKKGD